MQFITSIRITNAQMLLETTNYAVNEIARIVGYDNPLYFSRLFHKQKGCSPSEYRKLLKWANKRGFLSEWFSLLYDNHNHRLHNVKQGLALNKKSCKISLSKILQLIYHVASQTSSIFTYNICTKSRGLLSGYFLTAYALQTLILLAFRRSYQRVPWQMKSTFIIVA